MVFFCVNTCFYGLGWRWMSVNRSNRSIREVIVCEAEMLSRGIIKYLVRKVPVSNETL
jgi:hypothetical protein